MTRPTLRNTLRAHRERLALSQAGLAERVGVTRQAILAIEGGRQSPSATLALQLAHALGTGVEDLFRLEPPEGAMEVEVVTGPAGSSSADAPARTSGRVALGRVGGRWVGHSLGADRLSHADGIVLGGAGESSRTVVRPFLPFEQLDQNVLAAGCAPLLALLSGRVGSRFRDARVTWLPTSSGRALDLLEGGSIHVAGVHLSGSHSGDGVSRGDGRTSGTGGDASGLHGENADVVRARFPGERMLVVNLTRWRQGLVVPAGNPKDLRVGADLLRPGLRIVGREEGAAANGLLRRLLERERSDATPSFASVAAGHEDVARHVSSGAADVGVAIEGVAIAFGLDFVPLAEERFDLVIPAGTAETPPVSRLIGALDDPVFRAEVEHLPGYDGAISGHVITVDAA